MTLRVGEARLRVNFTGGSRGVNGVVPAKYVTDSPAVQQLIESSSHFRCGKVYLHGTPIEIEEEKEEFKECRNESGNQRSYTQSSPDYGGDPTLYV